MCLCMSRARLNSRCHDADERGLPSPPAGVELHYDVSVVDIRDATEKEIERGGLGCSCC